MDYMLFGFVMVVVFVLNFVIIFINLVVSVDLNIWCVSFFLDLDYLKFCMVVFDGGM